MEFFKNFDQNSYFLRVGKVDTKSDDCRNLIEFFNDFDQNTDGKF